MGNFAQIRNLMAQSKAAMIIADGSVAIRLKYKGSGTVTSVTVTTATSLVLITSDGGTDTYLFSAYATMGQLETAINGDGIFRARVLDALRDDTTVSVFEDGANTITSAGYYDLTIDSDAAFSLTYRCAYDRAVGTDINPANHRVELNEFIYYATLGNVEADDVQVFECDLDNNVETQVFQALSVSATATTVNFSSGKGSIASSYGNELVIRLVDDTSLADADAFLQLNYTRE